MSTADQDKRLDRFAMCGMSAEALYTIAQWLEAAMANAATVELRICYHGGRAAKVECIETRGITIDPPVHEDDLDANEYALYALAEQTFDNPAIISQLYSAALGLGKLTDGDGQITATYAPGKRRLRVGLVASKRVEE